MNHLTPSSLDAPSKKRTTHHFSTHLLNDYGGVADSNIAWWNPDDHTEQIPWRINRSNYTKVNSHLKQYSYHYVVGDPAFELPTLELWGVDAAGAKKIIVLETTSLGVAVVYPSVNYNGADGVTVSHVDTLHVCGLQWSLFAPSYAYEYEVQEGCVLLWSFTNEDQTAEIPIALP